MGTLETWIVFVMSSLVRIWKANFVWLFKFFLLLSKTSHEDACSFSFFLVDSFVTPKCYLGHRIICSRAVRAWTVRKANLARKCFETKAFFKEGLNLFRIAILVTALFFSYLDLCTKFAIINSLFRVWKSIFVWLFKLFCMTDSTAFPYVNH